MSELWARPFTPRAKEIADPFPLNGECARGPEPSTPAAHRYYPAHSKAGAQSSDHHNPLCAAQAQTPESIQAERLHYTDARALRSVLAPGHETPTETINTPATAPSDRSMPRSHAAQDAPYSYLPSLISEIHLLSSNSMKRVRK